MATTDEAKDTAKTTTPPDAEPEINAFTASTINPSHDPVIDLPANQPFVTQIETPPIPPQEDDDRIVSGMRVGDIRKQLANNPPGFVAQGNNGKGWLLDPTAPRDKQIREVEPVEK